MFCVCEVVARQLMLLGLLLSQKENCKITINYFLFLYYCGFHVHFDIWSAILKRRDLLEVIDINGRV